MLPYKADDRSILLPFYRRYVVGPFLPYIPRRVHPNTITHAGHLINLAGMLLLLVRGPQQGWLFLLAAATVQFYLWCDNADGAHARRTHQSSAYGEFLDHGLDLLNVLYISYLTALALGLSGLGWVLIVLVIPGGGAVTQWEQSQTGVFRLGLLNQVEAVLVLAGVLCASGLLGTPIWQRLGLELPRLGWLDVRLAILIWVASTLLFGQLRAVIRVAAQQGLGALASVLPLFLLSAGIAAAHRLGILSTLLAVALASGVNGFFGMRMLRNRFCGQRPRGEPVLMVSVAALGGFIAASLGSKGLGATATWVFVVALGGFLGQGILRDVCRTIAHLSPAKA